MYIKIKHIYLKLVFLNLFCLYFATPVAVLFVQLRTSPPIKPDKVLVSMITSDKFCELAVCRIEKYFPFICSESYAFNITEYFLYSSL